MSRVFLLAITCFWSTMGLACEPAPGVPGEDVLLSLTHDGVERRYILHLPSAYDCATPLPLLLGLHGYGGTGSGLENETLQIFDHINANSYIGVFPNGVSASADQPEATGFNDLGSRHDDGPDGLTCEPPPYAYPIFDNCPTTDTERLCSWGNSCADDLEFFRALIQHLVSAYSVDTKRIYMTGFSQGGSTVNGLAAELADLFAAVAPLHGFATNGYARGATSPLPFLQVWGKSDTTVPGMGEAASDRLIYESAEETADIWAAAQGCTVQTHTPYPGTADGKLGWLCTQYSDCKNDSAVVTCSWDGGHGAPSDGEDNFGWDVVWDFFQQHPKP